MNEYIAALTSLTGFISVKRLQISLNACIITSRIVFKCYSWPFQMLVHNPQAYPEMSGKAVVIEPGKEHFVSVSASHTEGYANYNKCLCAIC